jgi:hypothetical protein
VGEEDGEVAAGLRVAALLVEHVPRTSHGGPGRRIWPPRSLQTQERRCGRC